ncbi:hypothetical protein ACXPWS_20630 [Mycobacterium sp. BMJ-28]
MAESIVGPLDINGTNGDIGVLRVNGKSLASDASQEHGEIACGHLTAHGDKATGAPAANFGSHVGVDGNIDVTGRVNAGTVRATKDVQTAHVSASGNKATGAPAANFASHVGVDGNIDVTGRVNAGTVRATKDVQTAHVSASGNKATGAPAANFGSHVGVDGNIDVTGDIRLMGADCAENFDVSYDGEITAGSVMVIDENGGLTPSSRPYDRRAVGVVSGAGSYRPAVIMDTAGAAERRCAPIGLIGKVYCKADATSAAIEVGDLLTTSAVSGHAMKAVDPARAFGAIVGKALGPLPEGVGLIPMLVSRQ